MIKVIHLKEEKRERLRLNTFKKDLVFETNRVMDCIRTYFIASQHSCLIPQKPLKMSHTKCFR